MKTRYLGWILALLGLQPSAATASVFIERLPESSGARVAVARSSAGSPRLFLKVDDMLLSLTGENGFIGRRWAGGIVHYDFDDDVIAGNQARFEAAARDWEDAVTQAAGGPVLRFVRRTTQDDYIRVFNSDVNQSVIGMQGEEQPLEIVSWNSHRTILHEIGHALGLTHEHQRGDRDDYVEILFGNVRDGERHNFDARDSTAYGPYDFLSVMHYQASAFAKPGTQTIVPRPGYEQYEGRLGNQACEDDPDNPCLSPGDRAGMARRYLERETADSSCSFTPSPSGWRQNGRVYYRLVMDRTWLFVPTGRIQIQPIDFTFEDPGRVQAVVGGASAQLYRDPDLTSLVGGYSQYPAGSGDLDYWFWADFEADALESVELFHKQGDETEGLIWSVDVRCGSPAGLSVAPATRFEPAGTVGGSFDPASQTYGLTNSGCSRLDYSLSVSYADPSATGWLSLSRTSGSLASGQNGSFVAAVNASAAGLDEGVYSARVEVRTTGGTPQTIERVVSLTIDRGASLPPVIAGRITTADGAPIEGVRMDGLPSVKWTGGDGEYLVYVGEGWSGNVRPFKAGYNFSPPSRTYSGIDVGVAGQNYTGTGKVYALSGRVTLDGAGLPGVVLSGLPGNPVTDASGNYSATVPFNWSGTVTPSAPGYIFNPAAMTYSEVGMIQVEESYTAARRTVTVSGRVTYEGAGLAGVWLGGLPGSVVTANDGTYAAAVPYGWSGIVTPSINGYVLAPSSREHVGLAVNLPAQDFAASQAPRGTNRFWTVATTLELNQASTLSRPGDMILVKPGTYLGVNLGGLDPGTVLASEAGADQTILEIVQFVVNMNDVVIDGFTFRTTYAFEPLHITGSSNVRLRNCRILAPLGEYGLQITDAKDILIERCVFSGYGGILIRSGASSGTLTLRNNQFSGNTVGVYGGDNPSLRVVIENNLFRNATRDAIDLNSPGSVLTRNNLFEGNATAIEVSSTAGSVQLTQDTLVRNGIAYDISGTISVLIYNPILHANTRGIDGASNATISVHHLMHWQDVSWWYGSSNYIMDWSTIWEADPKFVNAAAGDYRLASGSPARLVGQGGIDLGAYGGALGGAWRTPPGAPPPPPALLEIDLTGQDRTNPGDTVPLAAKAWFENGYYSPYSTFNSAAQWSSSNPSVLESLGAGKFRAVQPGSAVVTARHGSVSDTLPMTVLAPDLVLTAADSMDPVLPGAGVAYQISVLNRGPGLARNVQVLAQYDTRTSFASASPAPDAGSSNRWSVGDLQPGQSAGIAVTLNAGATTGGETLSLGASATAGFAAAAPATETTVVLGVPDLQIEASASSSEVRPGESLSSTFTFRNAGSAPARDVIVEGIYPSGTIFRSASPPPSSGTGTWFVGDLAPGEQRAVAVDLEAAPSAAGTLILASGVRSSGTDAIPGDNQAAVTVQVATVADLSLSVDDSPDPALTGEPVIYGITVINGGPSVAKGVTLTAHLPDGFSLESALPILGSCTTSSPVVCQLGSLPTGDSVAIEISGTHGLAGLARMTATAYANQEDPDEDDNLLTATTDVECGFTLSTSAAGFDVEGGTGSVGVTTAPGCSWTAASGSPWILITAGGSSMGSGTVTFSVAANPGAPRTGNLTVAGRTFSVTQSAVSLSFYTVQPCRILDTRSTEVLVSGVPRVFQVAGLCGVPVTAKAVSLNVTAVAPTGGGYITLWPADVARPITSAVSFSAGTTRASNAILALATDGGGGLAASFTGSGIVHFVVDVNGYFE